jgi:rhamnosyltransferase
MPPAAPRQITNMIAVVVTFHPDAERLMEGLLAILPQVDGIIVVDNGSPAPALDSIATLHPVSVIRLEANRGIAYAQNRGIAIAKEREAAFVLLLDQDSVASAQMAIRLRSEYEALRAAGERVGAVGPAQSDGFNSDRPRFTRFQRGRYLQVEAPTESTSLPCDMLIASGTLIPIKVLDEVGTMNEGLFIDKVDTEWCLRVRRAGFSIHGIPGAKLFHRLGESVLTVRWWRGKRLPVHKPFRYYYMVRNSLLLQRLPGMRWAWRAADLSQLLQIILFHGLLAPNARQNWPMIWRGLRDGALAVSGPLRQH